MIDAYLSPLLGRYLGRLAEACEERGVPEPEVMRSSGGTATAAEAARSGAWSVLSGPAGGAVGAGSLARAAGIEDAIGLDMGGTSCDVCVVEGGEVRRTDSREIDGRPIQLPMVDVHTVGAGGGSIGWRDPGGALRVGPRSAGAEPGPACYGRGGTEPTVTDANLLLGYLAPDSPLAGGVALDAEAAAASVEGLAQTLGLEPTETAEGIVRVANQEMIRALRVVTVERGIDPRRFALLPFGGAGPMHAAALAEELEITRILCPRASGVLSALGLIAAGRAPRHGPHGAAQRPGDDRGASRRARSRELADVARERPRGRGARGRLRAALPRPVLRAADPGAAEPDPDELAEAFAREHESRYGYRDPEGELELVTSPRRGRRARAEPRPRAAAATGSRRDRGRPGSAGSGSRPASCAVSLPAGLRAEGPCVFELPEATLVLPPGWAASVDEAGTIGARRQNGWRSTSAHELHDELASRPRHPPGAGRRAARGMRGDGRGPDPLGPLAEHQGAPRLLDRALRSRGRAGHAGRAHPRAPRLDAGRGGRDRSTSTSAKATYGCSTTPTEAAPTFPTSP